MTPRDISPRRAFDQRFALLLLGSDLVCCAASVLVAFAVRSVTPQPWLAPLRHDLWMYLRALPVVAGLWLIAFNALGLYEARRFMSAFAEMAATFRAVTLTVLLVAAASFLSHTDYSRAMLFLFWAAALPVTLLARGALRVLARRARARGAATARALVVGCGDLAHLIAARVRDHEVLGYDLVGFVFVAEHPEAVEGYPVLGHVSELAGLAEQWGIDEVLVARPDIDPDLLMAAIEACAGTPVEFRLVAGPLQVLMEQAEISSLADLPVVLLPPGQFPPWQGVVKRVLDVSASALLLLALAPLLLALAWLVRRQTGASAIFRQTRIGLHGAPFTMLKFRTMTPAADPYDQAPSEPEDQRITRTGRFLRRWSLDELPQLLNVLRGEMSLVGPRPEMPFIVEQYEPWQRRRLDAKPGITGLWQIMGRKDLPLRDNLEYDFYYIRNWSIWLDLTILLRTLPAVLSGRGAY